MKPDHTQYACLDRCPQEWVYRHARHLAAPAKPAAFFGQMVHLGVQQLSAGKLPELPEWESVDSRYTKQRALTLLLLYQQQWLEKPLFEIVWNEGYAESAEECAIPDRAVRSKVDGLLYAMDLKTTGLYISGAWQRHFEHNQQVAIQLDVLESVLGERIAGFWLDAIHISKTMPKASDLLRAGPMPYSESLRAELRAQRARKRMRIAALREHPEGAERRTESCMRYTELCPYFDLCKAEPADREALIQLRVERGVLKEEAWEPRLR